MNLYEAVGFITDNTMTYSQAAEVLGIHEAYARKLIEEAPDAENHILPIHGRPVLSRDFIYALRDARIAKAQGKAEAHAQAEQNALNKAQARLAAMQNAATNGNGASKPKKGKKAKGTPADQLPGYVEPTDEDLFAEVAEPV